MLTLALAKSPSDRYVDMNVFATNLEKLVFDIQLPEVNNQKISYSIDAINIPEQDNSRRVSKIDGMTMIYIPGGEFEMGSVEGREDEQPVHTVYLDPYWIDETEVTNKMFAKFLNENGNKSEKGSKWFFDNSPYTPISKISGRWQVEEGFEDHPVVEVNWYGAYAYSQWAGRRLPTEAEWEKAARGTNGWKFPWGNHKPDKTLLNFYSKVGMTTPVRSYLDGASIYGVLDMAGNVWEYVVDWYDPDYYKSLQETRWRNPKGPQSGTYKVGRGGSWINGIDFVRSTSRISLDPYTADMNIGFRCVLEA
jgi:formylglycine-generating enzyme required for sulfatase activity